MASKGWQSKGEKTVRRSPRQGKRQCARPFKAPRSVTTKDSEVELISETFIDVISETETEHGEVLRWSPDSGLEETKD